MSFTSQSLLTRPWYPSRGTSDSNNIWTSPPSGVLKFLLCDATNGYAHQLQVYTGMNLENDSTRLKSYVWFGEGA